MDGRGRGEGPFDCEAGGKAGTVDKWRIPLFIIEAPEGRKPADRNRRGIVGRIRLSPN